MTKSTKPFNINKIQEVDPILILWAFRILIPLGGYQAFIQNNGFRDDAIAMTLGLNHWSYSQMLCTEKF